MSTSFELMLSFRKDITKAESEAILDLIKKCLKDGKITSSDNLGIKHFSYPVKKETAGNYWLLKLQGSALEVKEIEKILRQDAKILRYLLTKSTKVKEK